MAASGRETILGYLRRRRHTALLAALVAALAVRPLVGDSPPGPLLFSLALLLVLFIALFTVQVDELVGEREVLLAQRKRRSIVLWALAIPAVGERLLMLVVPSPAVFLVGSISWFLVLSFITWSQLHGLLRQKQVTGEAISMSISIYLLLGMTWGVLYIVILQFQPHAFSFGEVTLENQVHAFPILTYFSLTTLSTVGFGDIAPLTLQARYAAVAEAITGQFYLAILVARLVGMHMAASVTKDVSEEGDGSV